MSTDTREERLARRIADLYATDPQFADAAPTRRSPRRSTSPGCGCRRSCGPSWRATRTARRSAQRAVEFVNDPQTGRTSAELLPRFETITYRELWDRVGAVATALAGDPSRARRPGRAAGLHQRRLHDHRRGAVRTRRGLRSAADERAGHPAAADRRRDRADRDRRERRLSRRRRRTGR